VLTARTDVASSNRNPTSRFAAGAATAGAAEAGAAEAGAAEAGAAEAGAATASPPTEPPFRPSPPRPAVPPADRRRVPKTAWAAAAILALLTAVIAFWAVALNDPDRNTASPDRPATSEPASSEPATPTAEETDVEPPRETADDDKGDEPGTDDEGDDGRDDKAVIDTDSIKKYLEQYHDLVFEDAAAAYAQTGPSLQNAITLADYEAFWGRYEDVKVSKVEETGDRLEATAQMEFRYPDGTRQVEQHHFTFIEQNGRLVLDRDDFIEVTKRRS
jgi:hypothetical protein